jgi:hypothetical protein
MKFILQLVSGYMTIESENGESNQGGLFWEM